MKNAFFLHSSKLSCTSLGSTNPTWEMTGIEKTAHLTMVVTALLSCPEPGITNPALGPARKEPKTASTVGKVPLLDGG